MTIGHTYWIDQEEQRQRIARGPELRTRSDSSGWVTAIIVILLVCASIGIFRHIRDVATRLSTPAAQSITDVAAEQQRLDNGRPYWRRGLAGLAGARSSQLKRGFAVFILSLVAEFWFSAYAGRFLVPLAGMLVSYVVCWGVPEGVWPSVLMCAVVVSVAFVARSSEE